jgi:hypothetical protein
MSDVKNVPASLALTSEHVTGLPVRALVLNDLENLHHVKALAYGPSWRKHGEALSIVPNIFRKLDRLAMMTDTPDEHRIDTVADLACYAMLYRLWLREANNGQVLDEGVAFHVSRTEVELVLMGDPALTTDPDKAVALWESGGRSLEMVFDPENVWMFSPVSKLNAKRFATNGIAAAAVAWLCAYRRSNRKEYTAWASQWTK